MFYKSDEDYVDGARLRLSTAATNGPIVHPQVTSEHGEPWWNDAVNRRKLLIRPPELSGNPASSVIW
jgi:hypothetical protein